MEREKNFISNESTNSVIRNFLNYAGISYAMEELKGKFFYSKYKKGDFVMIEGCLENDVVVVK